MAANDSIVEEKFAVLDQDGQLLFWADPAHARRLLSLRAAQFCRAKDGTRTLRARREEVVGPVGHADWALKNHWPSPFVIVAAKERRAIIDACLDELSDRQRQIVRLRYWNELTFIAAGKALGITEEAACQLNQRALDAFRGLLNALGIYKLDHLI